MIRISYRPQFTTAAEREESVEFELEGNWDATEVHKVVDRLDVLIRRQAPHRADIWSPPKE